MGRTGRWTLCDLGAMIRLLVAVPYDFAGYRDEICGLQVIVVS
jgi:hypothetical protein